MCGLFLYRFCFFLERETEEAERQSHMTSDGEDGNYITEAQSGESWGSMDGWYMSTMVNDGLYMLTMVDVSVNHGWWWWMMVNDCDVTMVNNS